MQKTPHTRSLSDLEIAGCKSTAAAHFSPSFCPIARLLGCKSGKNWTRWGRFSLSALQVRLAPSAWVQAISHTLRAAANAAMASRSNGRERATASEAISCADAAASAVGTGGSGSTGAATGPSATGTSTGMGTVADSSSVCRNHCASSAPKASKATERRRTSRL